MANQEHRFYYLRSASIPVSKLFNLHKISGNSNGDEYEALFDFFISELKSNPLFRSAVYTSSPILLQEFVKFKEYSPTKKIKRAISSIYKYYSRTCSKPVPFGLFSGCALGTINNQSTQIERQSLDNSNYYIDLDYEIQYDIANYLVSNDSIIERSSFYANNTIYSSDEIIIRYIKNENVDGKDRHFICTVENNYYLNEILALSKNGVTFQSIRDHFAKSGEIVDEKDLFDFFKEMIKELLLVPSFYPLLTERNYISKLLNIKEIAEYSRFDIDDLKSLNSLLGSKRLSHPFEHFQRADEILRKIMGSRVDKFKNRFAINVLHSYRNNSISEKTFERIRKTIEQLSPLLEPVNSISLMNFKKKFLHAYDDSEIPLLEALDPALGIGYGLLDDELEDKATPLIKPIGRDETTKNISEIDLIKISIAISANENNQKTVQLTKDHIESLRTKPKIELPREYSVSGALYKKAGRDIFHLQNVSGPNAYFKLSKFFWSDKDLRERVEKHKKEQIGDYVLAEIIHAPSIISANIVARPLITTDFHIPIINNSNYKNGKTVLLSDIVVSITGNRILLRSKTLNKYIIPINNTALNYGYHNISVFKFLCDVQEEYDLCYLIWQWDKEIFKHFSYLPRIEFNSTILSKGKWNLLYENEKSKEKIELYLNQFFEQHKVPNIFFINNFDDDEILIDRRTQLGLDLLIQELLKRNHITISEYLGQEFSSVNTEEGNEIVSEIIIPVRIEKVPYQRPPAFTPIENFSFVDVQREFYFGTKWTYLKIYCNIKVSDVLLLEEIGPFMEKMKAKGIIDIWFFIRYKDPEPHIRLRYFSNNTSKEYHELIIVFIRKLDESKFKNNIKDIQICKYRRELERYGWRNITNFECVFNIDSEYTITLINLCEKQIINRELVGFCVLKNWLDTFFENPDQMLNFCIMLRDGYVDEFKGENKLNRELNFKFEITKDLLWEIQENSLINNLLKEKKSAITTHLNDALSSPFYKNNPIKTHELFASLIHMSINRMFNQNQRKHELILYHFMVRSLTRQKFKFKK